MTGLIFVYESLMYVTLNNFYLSIDGLSNLLTNVL